MLCVAKSRQYAQAFIKLDKDITLVAVFGYSTSEIEYSPRPLLGKATGGARVHDVDYRSQSFFVTSMKLRMFIVNPSHLGW